jgi:hypothetical protein
VEVVPVHLRLPLAPAPLVLVVRVVLVAVVPVVLVAPVHALAAALLALLLLVQVLPAHGPDTPRRAPVAVRSPGSQFLVLVFPVRALVAVLAARAVLVAVVETVVRRSNGKAGQSARRPLKSSSRVV